MPSDDVRIRRWHAAEAGHRGTPEVARGLLGDEDPSVRCAAISALDRLGALSDEELVAAGVDADPTVRSRVATLMATAGARPSAPAAAQLLTDLLADPDSEVVEVAAWAAGEHQPPGVGVVEALCGVVRTHDDALCREAAVAALGALGEVTALPTVLGALDDRATVRRRAIIALAAFEGPEVEAALRRHLEDRDRQVRQAAEDLLGRDP